MSNALAVIQLLIDQTNSHEPQLHSVFRAKRETWTHWLIYFSLKSDASEPARDGLQTFRRVWLGNDHGSLPAASTRCLLLFTLPLLERRTVSTAGRGPTHNTHRHKFNTHICTTSCSWQMKQLFWQIRRTKGFRHPMTGFSYPPSLYPYQIHTGVLLYLWAPSLI